MTLASLALTTARLDAFLTYQRALLRELAASSEATTWSGRYAFAHGRALLESKLDTVELGKLKAMVADFCARRGTYRDLKERLERGGDDEAKAARIRAELPRLEDLSEFTGRYGEAASQLLREREAEVLELHRALAQVEGRGHLHPA